MEAWVSVVHSLFLSWLEATDGAYRGHEFFKGAETGVAEGTGGNEGAAQEAPGWIEKIDEFSEQAHPRDCLWNSSKEERGLMPGHASWAMIQFSGSFKRAG